MSVFSLLILISWEQVTRSPLTTHKDFPLSIQPLNLSQCCYSSCSCLFAGFTLQILFISYCSCTNFLLSSLWLVSILTPLSSPSLLCPACCLAMALPFQRIPSFSSFPLLLYSFRFPFLAAGEGLHTRHYGWVCSVTTGPDSPPASWVAWK